MKACKQLNKDEVSRLLSYFSKSLHGEIKFDLERVRGRLAIEIRGVPGNIEFELDPSETANLKAIKDATNTYAFELELQDILHQFITDAATVGANGLHPAVTTGYNGILTKTVTRLDPTYYRLGDYVVIYPVRGRREIGVIRGVSDHGDCVTVYLKSGPSRGGSVEEMDTQHFTLSQIEQGEVTIKPFKMEDLRGFMDDTNQVQMNNNIPN